MEKVTVNGRIFQTEKGTVLADVLREAGGLKCLRREGNLRQMQSPGVRAAQRTG